MPKAFQPINHYSIINSHFKEPSGGNRQFKIQHSKFIIISVKSAQSMGHKK